MTQQLVMTPQLQQAIKLLQLSRLELTEIVQEEMMENPLLEEQSESEVEASVKESSGPTVDDQTETGRDESEQITDKKAGEDEIDWERYLENYQHLGPTAGAAVRPDSDDLPGLDQTLTRSATLFEHLIWQVRLSSFTDAEIEAATFIIGNLDDDGYFKVPGNDGDPLIACAHATGVSLTESEQALRKVQSLDPAGIASRDLRECLLIQARQIGEDDTLVGEIIRNHLPRVEARNARDIAKELDVCLQAVIEAIQIIQEMEPRPGRQYTGAEPQYITPDVYVYKIGDKLVTVVNDDGLSKLRVSGAYRSLLTNGEGGEAKDYIRERLRSAQFLIRSIHQRQRTIHKVTESIVRFQREFFEKGVSFLRPLILRDVAEDIGMHESTVSRVTSNKYLHCSQGIHELKFFFNSAIGSTSGDGIASQAVKSRIENLVAGEDLEKPLSDKKIVDLLRGEGIEIARRTVAKYRDHLGILPSSKRKRLY